ncbi:uncharacterized protein LOC132399454 [Hypanus sabinus]|uniref:uncharacterized protein LOC132399454 n=1 Tax=Hypanus sabinus TaxID=79690 RepID=UPI0028C4798F|nr:uncharacterized protein LOC132399454 [Hypanus sabinus]
MVPDRTEVTLSSSSGILGVGRFTHWLYFTIWFSPVLYRCATISPHIGREAWSDCSYASAFIAVKQLNLSDTDLKLSGFTSGSTMTVSLWPRRPGSSLGTEGGLCALVFLLLFHNADAGIQIKTQQRDFFVIEGRNFTIAAEIKLDQGDTIASAFWVKQNGERQRIVDCLPDRVETASYSTYTGRARCAMQADKIALTLSKLTPKDSGDYELKITLNSGEIGTVQFTGKLYGK